MTRPHTVFVQAQELPWSTGLYGSGRSDVAAKTLSFDAASGAATMIVRYPAGWRRDAAHHLDVHEEFLVLDGELAINGRTYTPYCYANLPAGYTRSSASSARGAVVLTMFSGEPHTKEGAAATDRLDPKLLVEHIDCAGKGLEGWTENPYTRYLAGTGVQPLRQDPYTGEISILYAALPFRYMEKQWSHPTVQEMYLLSGEYVINDVGILRPGAYCWWRENLFHGPYGSHSGFMFFIRTDGGKLANIIKDDIIPVDYAALHNPSLPVDLVPYNAELPRTKNY
ncbi:MAG: DUF4437 domain-containing protein [Proteobacteria bacterium]|nr:DUF4437 domain-containing protein [Pseudomonadota bacterium]MDA1059246.1 DUF4437 domain-containing protein [Pseudomonadota bacterium]